MTFFILLAIYVILLKWAYDTAVEPDEDLDF